MLPACECCYEDHISNGGVTDDWDGGLPPVIEIVSTGEHRCHGHRDVGRRRFPGVGFEVANNADVRELASA